MLMVFFATASLIKNGSERRKVAYKGQFKVLIRRCWWQCRLLVGSLTSAGDSNAVTQVNTKALEEGRQLSRPQAVGIALNRHHTGLHPTSGYLLDYESGYNGKKNAYRRYARGRNARGSGRRK